jgi:hypothetical protein
VDGKKGHGGGPGKKQQDTTAVDDPGYWAHYAHALWVLLENQTSEFLPADAAPSYKWSSAKGCTSYTDCMTLIQTIRTEVLGMDVLLTSQATSSKKKGKGSKAKSAPSLAKGGEREAPSSFQLLLLQVGMQLREEMTLGDDDEDDDEDMYALAPLHPSIFSPMCTCVWVPEVVIVCESCGVPYDRTACLGHQAVEVVAHLAKFAILSLPSPIPHIQTRVPR